MEEQEPTSKKAKTHDPNQTVEQNEALADPETTWDDYAAGFIQIQFYQNDEPKISMVEFAQQLCSHLTKSVCYYQANLRLFPGDIFYQSRITTYQGAQAALAGYDDLALNYFLRAIELIRVVQLQEAEENEQEGVEEKLISEDPLPHYWLMATYFRMGNYQAVLDHVSKIRLDDFDEGLHYANPLYLHLNKFEHENIYKDYLYFAHNRVYRSELLLTVALARQKLNLPHVNILAAVFFYRAQICFYQHEFNLALDNFNQAKELAPNDSAILLGEALSQTLRGQYELVLTTLIPRILNLENNPQQFRVLNIATALCLDLRKMSRARPLLTKIAQSRLQLPPLAQCELLTTQLKLSLEDEEPFWTDIKSLFETYFANISNLSVEALDHSEHIECATTLVNRYLHRYHRLNQRETISELITLFVQFYDNASTLLRSSIAEHHSDYLRPRSLPNRCYDRVYLRYHTAILKMYTWFPQTQALDALALVRNQLSERVRKIPEKLQEYDVPMKHNGFVDGVESQIKLLLQLSHCAILTTGTDFGLAKFIKQSYFNTTLTPTSEEIASSDEDEQLTPEIPVENIIVSYSDLYTHCYQNTVVNLLPKPNQYHTASLIVQYQRFLKSKKMAANLVINNLLHQHTQKLLDIDSLIDDCLGRNDTEHCLQLTENLNQEFAKSVKFCLDLYQQFQNSDNDPLVITYLREKLIETTQFHYQIYLSGFNHVCEKLLAQGDAHRMQALLTTQTHLGELAQPCHDGHRYHNEHALIMSIKLRNAIKLSASHKEEILALNITQIRHQRDLLQSSAMNHALDIFYSIGNVRYRIPFPETMLCESIKLTSPLVVNNKNLSAHVLTLVFSLPKSAPSDPITLQHLHLPLGFVCEHGIIVNSVNETEKIIHNLKPNILQRMQRGFDLVHAHRTTFQTDTCQVIPQGTKPVAFEDLLHLHSEQYFYAWLAKATPQMLVEQLKKLPGGMHFRPGVTVHALSFDMASVRTSCHPCRLSAMAMQNHEEEFVSKFAFFLPTAGFFVANNFLRTMTRVIAAKNNGYDSPELEHHNPNDKELTHLHNFSLFQIKQPNCFVSGSSLKAFK